MGDVDIRTLEIEQGSWAQTGKDLGSGAAGGIAQVLLGEFKHFQAVQHTEEHPGTSQRA